MPAVGSPDAYRIHRIAEAAGLFLCCLVSGVVARVKVARTFHACVLFRSKASMPHNTLVTRLRAEYLEMPGLQLTLEQAQRLCGIERALCKKVFDALVAEKFLYVKPDGAYARSTEGAIPRPRLVKADLGTELRVATAS